MIGVLPLIWMGYQSSADAADIQRTSEAPRRVPDASRSVLPWGDAETSALAHHSGATRLSALAAIAPRKPSADKAISHPIAPTAEAAQSLTVEPAAIAEPVPRALKAQTPQLPRSAAKQKKPRHHHSSLLADFVDDVGPIVEPSSIPAQLSHSATLSSSLPTTPDDEESPVLAENPPTELRDPELGVIEVADPRRDPELGVVQLRNPLQDPELGILELRQFSPPPPPRPLLYISTYVAASSSDNVFLVEDPVQGRFGDNFMRPGISVFAFPSLGPQTNLLASAEANFLRYDEQSLSNYDEVRFRAAVRHQFTNRVYGQVGVSSQLLFREGFGEQFFTNNSVEWMVRRRDPLTPRLTLDTFYQGQVFFSDPSEFSNVLNSLGGYLGYRFAPQWETGIAYRFSISDFTRQSRREAYQRITGQLRYSITPSVRMSVFGGLSYGRSSEDRVTFDDSFIGISFDATIQVY